MSPRRGGEADKFGNRYEGRWTVQQLLFVLLGQVDSVTVEEAGAPGRGAEFLVRRRGTTEAHQVKRQVGNANEWKLQALDTAGVLKGAAHHALAGREFHFVSLVPARTLDELTDRARRSATVDIFLGEMLTNELRPEFKLLCKPSVFGSIEQAWTILKSIHVQWPDERNLRDVNSAFAGILIDGAPPPAAAVVLGDLVLDNLNVPLDATRIDQLLDEYELRRAQLVDSPSLMRDVQSALDRWRDSIARELLQPVIQRTAAADAWDQLRANARTLFIVGAAGQGKSAAVHQLVDLAQSAAWTVLALRLDRVGSFATPVELGQRVGLTVSPVSALAAVSGDRPCLLIIDQLDAVGFVSGRMPAAFDVVASLLREASGFPNMRIVLVCRKYDLENDERIRAVARAEGVPQVDVGPLTDGQVNSAVQALRVDANALTHDQRNLLSSPFNLVLLRAVADQADVLSFGSNRDLLDAYWERKRRNCRQGRSPAPRFDAVIATLVDTMSERQRLAVSVTVLDHNDLADDAQALESEHIIVRDGRQYAFFHEAFFDYAFARRWINQGQTLVDFLLGSEQELFRRGQVRQVLDHLYEDDHTRFITEAEALIRHPKIRFHIKDAVLAFLRALPQPSRADWTMVKRIINSQPEFINRMWLTLRTLPWFDRLDAEGEIARGLTGNQPQQVRVLEVALGAVKDRSDRLAELITSHAGHAANYPDWLRWVTRFADVHNSRPLLDLMIEALRRGEYVGYEQDLWMSVFQLADHHPSWAIDLLSAYLNDQPGAFTLDNGRVQLLLSTEHGAIELTTKCAERAPSAFCTSLLPYLQTVMKLTEYDTERRPIKDLHFASRVKFGPSLYQLEDALEQGARTALRRLTAEYPETAKPFLEQLAADPHETAQWLLYEALQEADKSYAEWAASVLLEGDYRLYGATSSGIVQSAARLLAVIGPRVSAETFNGLEQAILQLRVPCEQRSSGWNMFHLLAALPESRLSGAGRRRLGELQRRFGIDQPSTRQAITDGFSTIASPIPQSAAQHMTDDHWLRAIAKYNSDREDWTTMRGGARELSSVLQNEAAANPDRFARLALRLGPETHAAYLDGILLGLGHAQGASTADLVFDAVRHIASLSNTDNDRWLSWPLRRYLDSLIPDDIIELVLDRALHSLSPEREGWQQDNGDSRRISERISSNAINSTRGACTELLGDILNHDTNGHRTRLVSPSLDALASDPSVAVRSSVAHLIATCLRYAQPSALEAYQILVQTDDRLLATTTVANLTAFITSINIAIARPVIERMTASEYDEVRRVGGQLTAFAGLEFGETSLFQAALNSTDAAIRVGLAESCGPRLPHTSNPILAGRTLERLFNDPDEEVRKAAAGVVVALRDKELGPFADTLRALIESPAFELAVHQLVITLEHAPDSIDRLAIATARRYLDTYGLDVGNPATMAATSAREIGQLVFRAYSQAQTGTGRSEVLDLIDRLLMLAAYGVDELVNSVKR